jgi:alkylglycerol monooxygenase
MNVISVAIPVFFVMIAIEWFISHKRGLGLFKLSDTLSNLFCGAGSQIIGAISAVTTFALYVWAFENITPFKWSTNALWEWVVCVLLVDLGYYWFHRASHRVQIFWACHIVHHQSEEYNLSVALRQSWFGGFIGWVFYIPLVLIGFTPVMVLSAKLINLLYQFWVHTRLVKTVGVMELFLVTPSNHRVHHGCDERSLDTNYGGIFIVWDRMFGTFTAEETEPPYGTVKPLASFDPLRANLDGWLTIGQLFTKASTIQEKLYAFFAPPEWYPKASTGYEGLLEGVSKREKYSSSTTLQQMFYVLVHFSSASLALTAWLNWKDPELLVFKTLAGSIFIFGFTAWGSWLSNRPSWKIWELFRLAAMTGFLGWALGPADGLSIGLLDLAWFVIVIRAQPEVGSVGTSK